MCRHGAFSYAGPLQDRNDGSGHPPRCPPAATIFGRSLGCSLRQKQAVFVGQARRARLGKARRISGRRHIVLLNSVKGKMASMGHKGNLLAAPVPAFPQSPQPADGRYSPPQRPQQTPSPMLLSADFVTKHGQNVPVPQMDFSPPDNKKTMKSSSSSFKNLIPPIFTSQSSQKNVFNGPRDDPLARPYQVDGMEHVRLFDNWNQATQGSASARRKSTDETYLNARAGWKEYQK
eukprot:600819-Rhodomonas_salina.1